MQHERDQLTVQGTGRLKDELMMPVGEIGGAVIASIFVVLFLWGVPKFAEVGQVPVHLHNRVQSDARAPG